MELRKVICKICSKDTKPCGGRYFCNYLLEVYVVLQKIINENTGRFGCIPDREIFIEEIHKSLEYSKRKNGK